MDTERTHKGLAAIQYSSVLSARLDRMESQLDRIESKLDKLIEMQGWDELTDNAELQEKEE